MKKPLLVLVIIILPISFFGLAYQSYGYKQQEAKLGELVQEQRDLLEENKRLIGMLARLESPDQIGKRALEEAKMKYPDQSNSIKIKKVEKE